MVKGGFEGSGACMCGYCLGFWVGGAGEGQAVGGGVVVFAAVWFLCVWCSCSFVVWFQEGYYLKCCFVTWQECLLLILIVSSCF